MTFTRRLRDRIRSGEITLTIRFWLNPRVTVGRRYRMDEGEIEVDSIEPIGLPDITSQLAQASGFLGVLDLIKVAKHGKGERIYLIHFHYIPPKKTTPPRSPKPRSLTPASSKPVSHKPVSKPRSVR